MVIGKWVGGRLAVGMALDIVEVFKIGSTGGWRAVGDRYREQFSRYAISISLYEIEFRVRAVRRGTKIQLPVAKLICGSTKKFAKAVQLIWTSI